MKLIKTNVQFTILFALDEYVKKIKSKEILVEIEEAMQCIERYPSNGNTNYVIEKYIANTMVDAMNYRIEICDEDYVDYLKEAIEFLKEEVIDKN